MCDGDLGHGRAGRGEAGEGEGLELQGLGQERLALSPGCEEASEGSCGIDGLRRC